MNAWIQSAKKLLFAGVGLTDAVAAAAVKGVDQLAQRGQAAWQQLLHNRTERKKQAAPECLKKLLRSPAHGQTLRDALHQLTEEEKQVLSEALQQEEVN